MKTYTITKDDILEAIETEPVLTSHTFGDWEDCPVCVVGAIIKKSINRKHNFRRTGGALTEGLAGEFSKAKPGNYLSALSILWEKLNCLYPGEAEDLRSIVLDWAEENIPDDYVFAAKELDYYPYYSIEY